MKKYHIYGIGAALVDTEVVVTDSFLSKNKIDKGVMTLVDEARQLDLLNALDALTTQVKLQCGGSACNSIVAASYFGSKTFYSGKVADDDDGKFFVNDLQKSGVDFHNAEANSGVTGKCLVMVTKDAGRTMNTFLGASLELTYDEVDEPALTNSEWLYLEGYLVTDEARTDLAIRAMEFAKSKQVKTSISLSDPFVVQLFEKNLRKVIGDGVDLMFCNYDEALSFTKTSSAEQAAEELVKYAKVVVITLGADGSLCYDGSNMMHTHSAVVKAVDSNGAGDMYAGAFLYAINAGHSYALAAKLANQAASKVVSQFGPRIDIIEYQKMKKLFDI